MSKYIAIIPRAAITRAALVEAGGRSMDQVKAACGCSHIINSWFYDTTTGRPVGNLCIDGTVKANAGWAGYGLTWDKGADMVMELVPSPRAKRSYLSGVELLTPSRGPGATLDYKPEYGGSRGRSAVLLAGEMVVLYCSGDGTKDAKKPEGLRDELVIIGKQYAAADDLRALGLDAGSSSNCDFGGGQRISNGKRVKGYLCIWTKEDGNMDKTYKVCLDPGHGVESPGKESPDGSYKEHEFALDVAKRMKKILEAQGVQTIMTRDDEHCPTGKADVGDLYRRVDIANAVKDLDLFVSLHSNSAAGSGWSGASGYCIYTSAGPETAARNVAAMAIVEAVHKAGVQVRSTPVVHDIDLVVTRKTNAPAVLIEHGFHTNREEVELLKASAYREKLAEANCRGILTYLGKEWQDDMSTEGRDEAPDEWAKTAWEKAKKKTGKDGKPILDGTRPRDTLTRQELAVVLDRLGLLD